MVWHRLNQLCAEVRQAVKSDRCRYLQQLVDEVEQADLRDPRHLYRCVRRAFPKAASAKRSRFTPLPAVALPNGELAVTSADRAARWQSHFAAQECGRPVTPAAYSEQFADTTKRPQSTAPTVFDRGLLPSLAELEASVLQLKRGKAAGADGLLPLFVKSLLTLREPVEFKGGALMTLAKKAAAAFTCDRYRSILLSSDLMGGVQPGVGVDSIAAAVRSFQAHVGEHPAVVFFDVRAAYYQVVRDAALAELHDHLVTLIHIVDNGGSAHLEAITRELFAGTWFRLDQHVDLVATSAGVRPGDPLADVFFGLSFSAYIRSVQDSLRSQGLVTVLPPCATSLPVDGLSVSRELPPASWADDFAAMLSAAGPAQVVHKVTATTTAFLTHATSIGMQLSFAVDKTAALLPPQVLFAGVCEPPLPDGVDKEHAILVRDDITQCSVRLPAVQAYKHLGGIVTCTASLLPEIYYRFSQCTWTLRPLRGTLFGNPSIPLPLRRTLLGSLVATKFTFGSATMELHVACQWRLWARLYTSIWKAMQPRSSAAQKIHSYEVLRQACALAPPLALAKARGSLYLRVLEHGPSTLLQLWWLQWESSPSRSWLAMLRGDLDYVALYCPAVRLLLDSECPLHALTEAMLQDRTWWRRQINAAARLYFEDLDRWARRRAETPSGAASLSPRADAEYQCPFCPAGFPLKKHLSVHIARRHGLPAVTEWNWTDIFPQQLWPSEDGGYPYAELYCGLGALFTHFLNGVTEPLWEKFQGQSDGDCACEERPIEGVVIEGTSVSTAPTSPQAKEQESPRVAVGPVLMMALSIHSLLEGLSLGAAGAKAAWGLFLAIFFHKGITAFALGVAWLRSLPDWRIFLVAMFCFSVATPIGVLIGESVEGSKVGAVLQALAAGIFLYIGLTETAPGVMKPWLKGVWCGLQMICTLLGFGAFALLAVWC
ncbi:zntD [Symbiodinium sp. CCMP2592]|nr:zntD [Symbiodinium sp. CCMP2592]